MITKLEKTAYHEAGHAVAAMHYRIKFKYVTIIPDYESAGHVRNQRKVDEITVGQFGRDRLEKYLIYILAGNAAIKKLTGRYDNWGASADHAHAADIVLATFGSIEVANAYLKYINLSATAFVNANQHWVIIEKVAQQLLERKTLTQKEVFEIREQHWDSVFGKITMNSQQ